MAYHTYICDDCGFSSEEERGVYICPKCRNKMRIAQPRGTFGGGDLTQTDGKLTVYIIFTVIALPILFGLLNIFGVIIFIVLFYLLRKLFNSGIRNQAIRVEQNDNTITYSNISLSSHQFCTNCGHKVQENQKFCSNCGLKIE